MPQLPKPRRVTGAEQEAPAIRQQVRPTVEGQGLAALGKGVQAAAFEVGDFQERFRANKLTTQALGVAGEVKNAMINVTAEFKRLEGNDAKGTLEYNDAFEKTMGEILDASDLDRTTFEPLIRAKLATYNDSNKTTLAEHQLEQQEVAGRAALDQSQENARAAILLDPADYENQIIEMDKDVDAMEPIIGEIEAQERRDANAIFAKETMINAMLDIDVEQGEKVLNALESELPKENVKVLKQEIQRRKNQAKVDEKEAKIAEENAFMNEFIVRQKNGDPMTVPEIVNSNISAKAKNTLINRTPDKYEITDPAVYAEMSSKISQTPEDVTQADIWALMGAGLSTTDAEKLDKMWQGTAEGDNPQKQNIATAKSTLYKMLRAGAFGSSDSEKAAIEWSKQMRALDTWVKDNPNDDPIPFVETMTQAASRGAITAAIDFFVPGTPDFKDPGKRRQAIQALNEAGAPTTDANIREVIGQLESAGALE